MHNNLAIFYCGTNGAGKSTLRSLNQDVVQIVIDSDHIAMQINPTNPRLADLEAGRKAIELFKFAIKNQISFSMESTLSGKSILQRMKTAKENDFKVRLNYVGVDSVNINIARVRARVLSGGHFIDEQTIKNRYTISREHLNSAISFCDEVFIFDNSGKSPKAMLYIENQQITQIADELVDWCKVLLDELLGLGFEI
ncbi:zeta toxin family protein [Bisgaard Taxon 10/6]|uniref:zeta toxin family protein n=1 Tax=Exercitatus varius TaxID=67857 RepID=UPI0018A47FFB|nr:zeta toxin family protein [Exercitatus varius]MDG2959077.1 zeta toxin family protein [Exercitatus varius]MDG2959662.1 zeta toxin family protein [Exercitatus varius]QOF68239.1 zeta toxin family protein [Actinobacillus sp. GY-402]